MQSYVDQIKKTLETGVIKKDRTGVGTISIFGTTFEHDMRKGFPALTLKKLAWRPVVGELLWFMSGSSNVERLRELTWGEGVNKKTIWDDNYEHQGKGLGYKEGELGPVYGVQWRNFSGVDGNGVDQLKNIIEQIKNDPFSRRHLVSAWNPILIDKMTLPPCHYSFQFNADDEYLDLLYNMRSNDLFLGAPFNIASYGLLLSIVAKMVGKKPRFLKGSIADTHIYLNHLEQAKEMISRDEYPLPGLKLPDFKSSDTEEQIMEVLGWTVDNINLVDYQSHPTIKAPMAV